jgi:membrane dipeptidase
MFSEYSGRTMSRRGCLRVVTGALVVGSFLDRLGEPARSQQPTKAITQRDPALIERAANLMRDAIVIDAYNCGAYAKHRQEPTGWFSQRGPTQVDLIKALEGKLTAAGFDLGDGIRAPLAMTGGRDDVTAAIKAGSDAWKDIPWPPMDGRPYAQTDVQRSSLANALMGLERFLREIEFASSKLMLVLKGKQIREAKQQGKIGVILHGNTSPMFEDSIEVLHVWYRLGLRMMILARAGRNLICDGWLEGRTNSKLTTFGVRVVKEMNRLGMVVDGSHMNDAGLFDLIEVSEQPVICSHSNSRKICPHPRNLSDELAKALAERGGVVGLTFPPHFIEIDAPPQYLGYTPASPLFQKWLDHCDHFLQLIGPDHIGIGSDFDGGGRLLEDMSQLPFVAEGLLSRGYQEADIRKILGENLLRVFEQVMV